MISGMLDACRGTGSLRRHHLVALEGRTEGKEATGAYGDTHRAPRLRTARRAARAKRDLGAPGRAPLRRPELGPQAGSQCPALGHWARSRSRSTEVPRRSLPRSWMDRISPFARERVAVPSKSRPLGRPVAARGVSDNRTLCPAVCWMRAFRNTPAKNFGE
jgi:hypothetical protein